MTGFVSALGYLAALLLIVAVAATTLRSIRYAALAGGIVGFVHFALIGRWDMATLAVLFVTVNAIQTAVLRSRARGGAMLEEEIRLFDRLLAIDDPRQQRHLRDLMRWRDVEVGEVLMAQDQPDPPLVYVARGLARVEFGGRSVGTCGPGEFLGEMSLVSGQTASATVVVAERARIATFDRDALAHYARAVPEVDTALTHALNRGLAAKVRRMNAASSGGPEEIPTSAQFGS